MPGKQEINIGLNVTANTQQAKGQLQDLQRTLGQIAASAEKAGNVNINPESMRQASAAAQELQFHLKAATNVNTGKLDLNKFNTSLKSTNSNLSSLAGKLVSAGSQGQQAFVQLAQSIAAAERPMITLGSRMSGLLTTLKNTARWQISSSILHGFMGALQTAYGYAQDLNKSLNNIRIVTGYDVDHMAKFADEANRAAKALSTTTRNYTEASLIYYQQGLDDDQVKQRTDATIKLANVSRQSAEEVSNQLTAVWNNFAKGGENLEYYVDVMAKLGATTASSTTEIATGLEKFAGVANTVGLSYNYAASALATITATSRQSADVVGTALKTLLARIQDLELGDTLEDGTTLGKYSKALETVGVNIKDANGELKNMDQILDEMGAKWKELSKDQQVSLAQTVAGTRQYAQLITLMDNWDLMQTNLSTAAGAAGTLQAQADIYAESWEAARDRVQASAESIYQALLDDKFFIALNNGFAELLTGLRKFIDGIGGLKGVILTIGTLVLNGIAGKIQPAVQNLFTTLKGLFQTPLQQAQQYHLTMEKLQQTMQTTTGLSMDKFSESQKIALQSAFQTNEIKQKELIVTKSLNAEERLQMEIAKNGIELAQQERAAAAEQVEQLQAQLNGEQAILQVEEARKGQLQTLISQQNEAYMAWQNASNIGDIFEAYERYQNAANAVENYKEKTLELSTASGNMVEELLRTYEALLREKEGIDKVSEGLEVNLSPHISGIINELQQLAVADQNMSRGVILEKFREISGELTDLKLNSGTVKEAIDKVFSDPKANKPTIQAAIKEVIAALTDTTKATTYTYQDLDKLKKLLVSLGADSKHIEQLDKSVKRLGDSTKRVNELMAEFNPKHIMTGTEALAKTAAMAGQVAMAFSSITSIFRAVNDETMSLGERITAILMGVSMLVPSFTGIASNIKDIFADVNTAIQANTISLEANKAVQELHNKEGLAGTRIQQLLTTAWTQNNDELIKSQAELTAETLAKELNIDETQKQVLAEKLEQAAKEKGVALTVQDIAAITGETAVRKVEEKGIWAVVKAKLADIAVTYGLAAAIGVVLLVIGALALAIWGIVEAYKAWKYNTPEEQLKRLQQAAANLKEELQGAKEEATQLKDSFNKYDDVVDKLHSCAKGSQEWKDALKEVNDQTRALIDEYPELLEMGFVSRDENGALIISKAGKVYLEEKSAQKVANLEEASMFADYQAETKNSQNQIDEIEKKYDDMYWSEVFKSIIGNFEEYETLTLDQFKQRLADENVLGLSNTSAYFDDLYYQGQMDELYSATHRYQNLVKKREQAQQKYNLNLSTLYPDLDNVEYYGRARAQAIENSQDLLETQYENKSSKELIRDYLREQYDWEENDDYQFKDDDTIILKNDEGKFDDTNTQDINREQAITGLSVIRSSYIPNEDFEITSSDSQMQELLGNKDLSQMKASDFDDLINNFGVTAQQTEEEAQQAIIDYLTEQLGYSTEFAQGNVKDIYEKLTPYLNQSSLRGMKTYSKLLTGNQNIKVDVIDDLTTSQLKQYEDNLKLIKTEPLKSIIPEVLATDGGVEALANLNRYDANSVQDFIAFLEGNNIQTNGFNLLSAIRDFGTKFNASEDLSALENINRENEFTKAQALINASDKDRLTQELETNKNNDGSITITPDLYNQLTPEAQRMFEQQNYWGTILFKAKDADAVIKTEKDARDKRQKDFQKKLNNLYKGYLGTATSISGLQTLRKTRAANGYNIDEKEEQKEYGNALVALASKYDITTSAINRYQQALEQGDYNCKEFLEAQRELERLTKEAQWEELATKVGTYYTKLKEATTELERLRNAGEIAKILQDQYGLDTITNQFILDNEKLFDDWFTKTGAAQAQAEQNIIALANLEKLKLSGVLDDLETDYETVANILNNNPITVTATGELDISGPLKALDGLKMSTANALNLLNKLTGFELIVTVLEPSTGRTHIVNGEERPTSGLVTGLASSNQVRSAIARGGMIVGVKNTVDIRDTSGQEYAAPRKTRTPNGGGGSSSTPKKSYADTDQENTRYIKENNAITASNNALSRLDTLENSLYGKNRINSLREKGKELEKLKKKNEDLVAAAEKYAKEDYDKLFVNGIEYRYEYDDSKGNRQLKVDTFTLADIIGEEITPIIENGVILNQEEILNKIYAWLDSQAAKWNSLSPEEQQRREQQGQGWSFIEGLGQAWIEKFDSYGEDIATAFEASLKNIEIDQQIKDNNFEVYTDELEIEAKNFNLKWDSSQRIVDLLSDSFQDSFSDFFTYANRRFYEQPSILEDEINSNRDYIYNLLGNKDFYVGEGEDKWTEAQYTAALEKAQETLEQNLEKYQELNEERKEFFKNVLSAAIEKFDKVVSHMDHTISMLDHTSNLLSLVGRGNDFNTLAAIAKTQSDVEFSKYNGQKDNLEGLRSRYTEDLATYKAFDPNSSKAINFKKNILDPMEEQIETLEDQINSSLEAALQKFNASIEYRIKALYQTFEETMSGDYGSFDALAASLERAQSVQEQYLTKTNQLYETNTMLRKINQEIDKTENNNIKLRLKAFANEIDLLKNKEKLSKSDLDIAKARYEVLQAQIALEEARDAKSQVRLRRDSEGNYGYVFTANESTVSDAEQNLADKQNALYNLALEQMNTSGEQLAQLNQEETAQLQELTDKRRQGLLSNEDYKKQRNEILSQFADRRNALINTYDTAKKMLSEVASDGMKEAWVSSYDAIIEYSRKFDQNFSETNSKITGALSEQDRMWDKVTSEAGLGVDELTQSLRDAEEATSNYTRELNNLTRESLIQLSAASKITAQYSKEAEVVKKLTEELQALTTAQIALNGGDSVTKSNGSSNSSSTKANAAVYAEHGLGTGRTKASIQEVATITALEAAEARLKKLAGFDTGGYTGSWGPEGKLALLHQKELVLNAEDTKNLLTSVQILREITDAIDLRAAVSGILTGFNPPQYSAADNTLEQQVTIHAEFPNVQNHTEIEEAFNSLINRASQYANRY